jgi:hypothetical protein
MHRRKPLSAATWSVAAASVLAGVTAVLAPAQAEAVRRCRMQLQLQPCMELNRLLLCSCLLLLACSPG